MEFKYKVEDVSDLKNPIFVVGLPGIGLVARIVVEYLVTNLKAKKIGELTSSVFPPMVVVNSKGIIDLIKNEIYLYRGENNDIIFYTGDVQPLSVDSNYMEQYEFSKKILEIARKFNVLKIYTFAGIDIGDSRITKKPSVLFATNSEDEYKHLRKLKIKPAPEDLPIAGAAGLIIGLAKEFNIDGACILGETSNKLIYGDFDSAKSVVKFSCNLLSISVGLKDIEKEARKVTSAFEQIINELKSISKSENEDVSYVR